MEKDVHHKEHGKGDGSARALLAIIADPRKGCVAPAFSNSSRRLHNLSRVDAVAAARGKGRERQKLGFGVRVWLVREEGLGAKVVEGCGFVL